MKKFKKNIVVVMIILIFVTTLLYAVFAFAEFEADPSTWSQEARAVLAGLDISITLIASIISICNE